MRSELILKFEFEASHSLVNYEEPHSHIWKLETSWTGEWIEGKIIDLILLREYHNKLINILIGTYLNDNSNVDHFARQFPTCETLSHHFHEKLIEICQKELKLINPTIELVSISVAICELNGKELGKIKLFN